MAPLNKDIHLTAQFLTFLRAGYYGQLMFSQALDSLECKLTPDGYTDATHKAFDKIDPWMKDLGDNLPILATAWSAPETFDAISAMGFMRELKKDLQWLGPQVEDALRVPELSQERDAAKLLAAAIFRSASTRNSYAETLYMVFDKLGAKDLAQRMAPEIGPAQEYAQIAQTIVNTFAQPGQYDPELCERLRAEASLTPGDFKAQIHDTNILLNVYQKEFTFELAEFQRDEADTWRSVNVPAVMAGYWRAYRFSPEECTEWQQAGIIAGPLAANWRRARFDPQSAITWMNEGFPPGMAMVWREAGFEPARAAALIKRGITDPSKAPRDDGGRSDEDDEG